MREVDHALQLQQGISDPAVDMALMTTARKFGLPKERVTKILEVRLPMMAKMADENPARLTALYAQPINMLPEMRSKRWSA